MSEPRLEQIDHQLADGNRLAHQVARAALRTRELAKEQGLQGSVRLVALYRINGHDHYYLEPTLDRALDAYSEAVGRAQREAG